MVVSFWLYVEWLYKFIESFKNQDFTVLKDLHFYFGI